jgi:hypothetical protein
VKDWPASPPFETVAALKWRKIDMASMKSPFWRRWLRTLFPSLFKLCPQNNYHWFWDHFCYCGLNMHIGDWHGGIYSFKGICEIPSVLFRKNGSIIARDFFLWLEQHPIKEFWEIGYRHRSSPDSEDYPYSYFRKIAMQKLSQMIDTSYF